VLRAQLSIQASTRKRYALVIQRFTAFAGQFRATALSASATVTAMYMAHVTQHAEHNNLGCGVVREARAAVAWWRECHGLPSHSEQPLVRRVCSTAAKQLTSAKPLQRRDATLADMRALVDHFLYPARGVVDLQHRMYVTGFVLAFAGFPAHE
jgi:hypothetical protein